MFSNATHINSEAQGPSPISLAFNKPVTLIWLIRALWFVYRLFVAGVMSVTVSIGTGGHCNVVAHHWHLQWNLKTVWNVLGQAFKGSNPTPESARKLTNKAVGRICPPNLILPISLHVVVIYLQVEKTLMTTQLISRLLGYPKLKHQFPEVQTSQALMLVLTH